MSLCCNQSKQLFTKRNSLCNSLARLKARSVKDSTEGGYLVTLLLGNILNMLPFRDSDNK